MHDRGELEQPKTIDEMALVLAAFTNPMGAYSNSSVRRRRGVAKVIVEEYIPLYLLAQSVENVTSARLTSHGHSGPDAIIQILDQPDLTVQITSAGESTSTALQREILDAGLSVFPNQTSSRGSRSAPIETSGRVLTTRNANTNSALCEVIAAVRRKIAAYRQGTRVLLVSMHRSPLTMTDDWQMRLRNAVSAENTAPYEAVYVSSRNICLRCDQGA